MRSWSPRWSRFNGDVECAVAAGPAAEGGAAVQPGQSRTLTPARRNCRPRASRRPCRTGLTSLLPSMAMTLPLPNFWWNTRSPMAKSETRAGGSGDQLAFDGDGGAAGASAVAARARPSFPLRRDEVARAACRNRSASSSEYLPADRPSNPPPPGVALRALPAGRAVARAEMRHLVEARGAGVAVPPKPPFGSVTSTLASGSSSRKREGTFEVHIPCMRRLVAK